MSIIVAAMIGISLIFALLMGNGSQIASAAVTGAQDAVSFLLSIAGGICFWSGLMEVMGRSGLSEGLSRLLSPLIRLIYGKWAEDRQVREAISQNMAANILGLGSAATPAGLRAISRMEELRQRGRLPQSALILLIVVNTTSMQLLPTTIAAVRSAAGAQQPFDILPAVWCASVCSVVCAVLAARLLDKGEK